MATPVVVAPRRQPPCTCSTTSGSTLLASRIDGAQLRSTVPLFGRPWSSSIQARSAVVALVELEGGET